jgi:hypothetical protein
MENDFNKAYSTLTVRIRRELHEAVDSIEPEDAIETIREKIMARENYSFKPREIYSFRVEAIRTRKASDDWPFVSMEFVIVATDREWAERIADDAIGVIQIHHGAYGAMTLVPVKGDDMTEHPTESDMEAAQKAFDEWKTTHLEYASDARAKPVFFHGYLTRILEERAKETRSLFSSPE